MQDTTILENNLRTIHAGIPTFKLVGIPETTCLGPRAHPFKGACVNYPRLVNQRSVFSVGLKEWAAMFYRDYDKIKTYYLRTDYVHFVDVNETIPDWCQFKIPEELNQAWLKVCEAGTVKRTIIL